MFLEVNQVRKRELDDPLRMYYTFEKGKTRSITLPTSEWFLAHENYDPINYIEHHYLYLITF